MVSLPLDEAVAEDAHSYTGRDESSQAYYGEQVKTHLYLKRTHLHRPSLVVFYSAAQAM